MTMSNVLNFLAMPATIGVLAHLVVVVVIVAHVEWFSETARELRRLRKIAARLDANRKEREAYHASKAAIYQQWEAERKAKP